MFNTDLLIEKGHRVRKYQKGAVIYEPEQRPKYVYFIRSGVVRMVTVNAEGKEFIQGLFKAGSYFGEPALLVDKPYLAYTITNQASEIILLNKKDFTELIEQDPVFSMELIQVLSNRLFYKSMMLEELANEKAEHRLTTIINYLLTDLKSNTLKITRQELADMTGLRVETVIRTVKLLEEKQLIRLEHGKIMKKNL